MIASLFAILELERDPLQLGDLNDYVQAWIRSAGGFAAVGLVLFFIFTSIRVDSAWAKDQTRKKVLWLVVLLALLSAGSYLRAAVLAYHEPPSPIAENKDDSQLKKKVVIPKTPEAEAKEQWLLIAGAFAIAGITLPFLFDFAHMRWGRIAALARLSFQEAVRRRILWVFLGFGLLFLFPPKWFVEVKPENEVRDSISVVEFATTVVLLFAFSLLAAMSIPTDVKNQTIHTIVTKPVERFEVVLGRIGGYVGLATVVILLLRLASYGLISASNLSEEARVESFHARVPIYGDLTFLDLKTGVFEGESVGREWDYRRYIWGGPTARHRLLYHFRNLPSDLAGPSVSYVPCEFSFDIYRTTKGEEGKGVQVSMAFITPAWNESRRPEYQAEIRKRNLSPTRRPPEEDPDWAKWNELAEEFGYYEYAGKEIADYHTFQIPIPAGLFRAKTPAQSDAPALEIRVKCESGTQLLGAAKRDLYLLAADRSFALNFFKGAFGQWLLITLVISLAVTLSTYLSGLIAWLATMFIVVVSFFREFIVELSEGKVFGGGPTEQFIRLSTNMSLVVPLENSPGAVVAGVMDEAFKWLFSLLKLLPDVDRFDWSSNVAEGFAIPGGEMLMAGLLLAGYLIPFLVLAYYLMKSREIAN